MTESLEGLRDFSLISIIFRLLLASVLSGTVGLERESHRRVAGFRTHILVCVGSAMAIMVGMYASEILHLDTDPMRIGAQVLSGIGFLGAGTILVKSTSKVTGLTTAAGLWCMASIGLACGVGFYSGAVICTAISLITVALLPKLEEHKKKKSRLFSYYLEVDGPSAVNPAIEWLGKGKFRTHELEILPAKSSLPGQVGIQITLHILEPIGEADILREILSLSHITMALPLQ
jgi:putative Mg2+ transporter-C (MgtC) family protein